ncbi:MAG: aconitate hydratase [Rikenellaceae bacterium]
MFDKELVESVYAGFAKKVQAAKSVLNREMTLAEKVLYAHLHESSPLREYVRGEEYVNFSPDRVAMQDATAQMALLQFMNAGRDKVAVPSSVHCDHLIVADAGAQIDLPGANKTNAEVYNFLSSVADRYSIGFWKPGAGIIHQVVLENYAFPGGMMVGTDSHTPNAGGMGMVAIGVGGADAVDVMAGMAWELKMPKLIGVKLTGALSGWAAAKDVILKLAGILTVKGGTNAIIEYFGEGARSLSLTGKATICNMGAEVGATTSIFPFDEKSAAYLSATNREFAGEEASKIADCLKADADVEANPEKYFDRVIEIDLSSLEPYINGPFTPDLAYPISEFAAAVTANGYPQKMEVGLIGSCTNSSYEDMGLAADVAAQALAKNIEVKAEFLINPGSEQVLQTGERDGIIAKLKSIGGVIMTNACGPCIGQWTRHTDDNTRANSIVTSFNRNFAKRADGNPKTHAFVASPQLVTALTVAGDLCFNPLTDTLVNKNGEAVMLDAPVADWLPKEGITCSDLGYQAPTGDSSVEVNIADDSKRLQRLAPFKAWDGEDYQDMPLLIKTLGKCTTDHISMAGSWLRFRGHLENISDNMLMGAVNAFNEQTNSVLNQLTGDYAEVSTVAKAYKVEGINSMVVAEENYGEGSSREHAAMEPRFLDVKVILAKSFARIHETNLKKQGMLALTFADKADYDKILETDKLSVVGLKDFAEGRNLQVIISHADGSKETIEALHTYNPLQIEWFRAGSALNSK